jgi:hypothetical protein
LAENKKKKKLECEKTINRRGKPAPRAAPALRAIIPIGKFHGQIAAGSRGYIHYNITVVNMAS